MDRTKSAAARANLLGLLSVTHLAWYKGDALAKARELAAEAAKADASKPEGFTLKMLANMVDDRLGVKLADAKGNPWAQIHSPLMEYRRAHAGARRQGRRAFAPAVSCAWHGSTRPTVRRSTRAPICRLNYDPAKKWPMVIQMHGFNPANPLYWRWWGVDSRHWIDNEFPGNQGVIYMEPHGRGNVQIRGLCRQ